jgi:hypothetical protein
MPQISGARGNVLAQFSHSLTRFLINPLCRVRTSSYPTARGEFHSELTQVRLNKVWMQRHYEKLPSSHGLLPITVSGSSVAYRALFGEPPSESLRRLADEQFTSLNRPSSLEVASITHTWPNVGGKPVAM